MQYKLYGGEKVRLLRQTIPVGIRNLWIPGILFVNL